MTAARRKLIREHNANARQALQTAAWAIGFWVGKGPKESEIYLSEDGETKSEKKETKAEMGRRVAREMKNLRGLPKKSWAEWQAEVR